MGGITGKARKSKVWDSYVGKKIGRLTIAGHKLISRGNGRANSTAFICQCECGKEKVVITNKLLGGNTISCGCKKAENARNAKGKYAPGEAARNHLFAQYRLGAHRRNHEFALSFESFCELTSLNCYYCGQAPSTVCEPSNGCYGAYIYNGIDRVDNNQGYTISNCVACCKTCNRAKRLMIQQEFFSWIEQCARHLKNNGIIGS
jgi:hypothetical protein